MNIFALLLLLSFWTPVEIKTPKPVIHVIADVDAGDTTAQAFVAALDKKFAEKYTVESQPYESGITLMVTCMPVAVDVTVCSETMLIDIDAQTPTLYGGAVLQSIGKNRVEDGATALNVWFNSRIERLRKMMK